MAKAKDHRSVYQRRNEIARGQGFSSYNEKRRAIAFSNAELDANEFESVVGGKAGGRKGEYLDEARLYYKAFHQEDSKDYSVGSAKAQWIIHQLGYVKDEEEWQRRYPRGVRE